jgi:quinol monooxygenase YgiN
LETELIHVVAIVTAKPGKRAEILDAMTANLAAVRVEDGCIDYLPTIDDAASGAPLGEDVIVVIEAWRDAAALQAHRTAPHMAAYQDRTRDLVADRAVHVLRSV